MTIAAVLHNVFINNPAENRTQGNNGEETSNSLNVNKSEGRADSVQTITIELLREKFNLLSKTGRVELVRALISKYGGNKLTDVAEEKYKDLLSEVEAVLIQ